MENKEKKGLWKIQFTKSFHGMQFIHGSCWTELIASAYSLGCSSHLLKCLSSYPETGGLDAQPQNYPSKTIFCIPRGYETGKQMCMRPADLRDCFSAAEIHWAPRIHHSVPHPLNVLYFMSLFRIYVKKKSQSNYLIMQREKDSTT